MSSKRKTKFNKSLEAQFAWIQFCKANVFSVLCRLCSKVFSISGGGITQVKIHQSSKLHISREKKTEGQCMIKKGGDNALNLKGTQITLAKKDLIRKEEIIRALKCVEFNDSFLSISGTARYSKKCFRARKSLSNTSKVRPKRNAPFNIVYFPT